MHILTHVDSIFPSLKTSFVLGVIDVFGEIAIHLALLLYDHRLRLKFLLSTELPSVSFGTLLSFLNVQYAII